MPSPLLRRLSPFALVALAACNGDSSARVQRPPTPEEQHAREMAAAYFAKDDRSKALEALKPLVEREDAQQTDLVHAASVYLINADLPHARELLQRAEKLGENDAALQYDLGRLAELDTDMPRAAQHYRRTIELAPKDAPTRIRLVNVISENDPKEAERVLHEIVDRGIDDVGPWYVSAVYKLGTLCMRQGREEEAARWFAQRQELDARKIPAPQQRDFDIGNLGGIPFPPPPGNVPAGTGRLPEFAAPESILPEFAGARGVLASDLDNDGDLDLVGWSERGLFFGLQDANFAWHAQRIAEGAVDRAVLLDLVIDSDHPEDVMDVVYAVGGELKLVRGARDLAGAVSWSVSDKVLPKLPSAPKDALALDFDHEGDLDLLFVGDFGAALLRNDGAASNDPKGNFVDVTAEAGLPRGRAFQWCISEDFDTDQDVDLWLVGAKDQFLASNLRGGKFGDASAQLADFVAGSAKPIVADFDGDSRPDVWSNANDGLLLRGQLSGRFTKDANYKPPGGVSGATLVHALDLDLDGALDLVWTKTAADGAHLAGQLAVALPVTSTFDVAAGSPTPPVSIEDLDGDLAWDLIAVTDQGLVVRRGQTHANADVRFGFRGKKDNRRAVGAIVEVRAKRIYRRVYWRGEATLVGVGAEKELDLLRITWPNGVVQYETRRDLGDRAALKDAFGLLQADGLVGSCPFLYSWNGRKYEFVSDVLGITPLGLPMEPGMLVPPDHDEYVLVRGEQLAPKDGVYELQFTEELREVTYLDRVRLDVVDHPAETEIYPNELFCFPPFPEPHTHTVRAPLAPSKATGSDGKDWTRSLGAIDGDYAAPFTPAQSQFIGLANPHFLELEFERDKVKAAPKLRLIATGWFFWTDASVNMASARDPEREFIPPILQVPDGNGGWRDAGPPLGFPAGKTKTMVIDVSAMIVRDDPRIRLFSSLRLYWDSIRLAVDADDAPLVTHALEPKSAKLWERGFSDPEQSDEPNQPERFSWERLARWPRWDQHPGMYTKLGEVLPLVTAVDDQFVILGAGDALTVKFDARDLPPLPPGMRRDYLVYLDGWAKDRDPNTVDALFVEPLPFHAMSGYPYGANEHFPNDDAHRAWRREWNTRDARRWIEPVTLNAATIANER